MKRIAFSILAGLSLTGAHGQQTTQVKDSFYLLTPVEVRGIRAGDKAPFSRTNISAKEIKALNLGQDLPFLLNQTPSVVVNSDAGNGVGYTGIRIRGTDATRINITLNGIPFNDAESQGTFFVDLPDFASSTGSIQVQRGVGSSSNGAGSFGGSINFSTNELHRDPSWEFNNSFGSFNTWKNTIKTSSGLIGNHFFTDLRLSRISSDGFIDRASSNLQSLHFTTGWVNDKTQLRFNIFSGKEKTYQAWYGISEQDLRAGNRTVNYAGTEKPGSPYDNETDNYWQDHYQFFINHTGNGAFSWNTAFFMTNGKGYYEQYKADEPYSKYGVTGPGTTDDFIRQLWLKNRFYGNIYALHYKRKKTEATLGGSFTQYDGHHFGKLKWSAHGFTGSDTWYYLNAYKYDANVYLKQQTNLNDRWSVFYDLQYRYVNYDIEGFRDNPGLHILNRWHFFNPKAGFSYQGNGWKGFLSYSRTSHEPNRDDFEAGVNQQPKPEKLQDMEASVERTQGPLKWSATLYYMRYKDQLVLTGQINDVGAYTRTNIPESYRAGIELQAGYKLSKVWDLNGNLTLSRNKVLHFTEYIDDYDNGDQQQRAYASPDIAFSPAITGAVTLTWHASPVFEMNFPAKYVSRQYLDNTQHKDRSLDPYYVQDIRASYTLLKKQSKEWVLTGQVGNLFNNKYEPNGYTYNYISGGQLSVNNYYFPMAGINYMIALNLKF